MVTAAVLTDAQIRRLQPHRIKSMSMLCTICVWCKVLDGYAVYESNAIYFATMQRYRAIGTGCSVHAQLLVDISFY